MAARPVLAAVDGDGAPAPVTRLQPFRMLIAVPEALLAQGLRALVEREAGVAVSEASGVEELGAALGEGAVDVCLLDPALAGGPGREGLAELLARIRDWSPGTQVVVVGASLDLDDVCGALAAGATGVVDRTDEVDLLAATRAAAGGSVVLSPSVGTILTGGCGPRTGEAVGDAATRIEELTPRELEVLRCLAAGQRNTAIAESLVISERTVKTHVGRILQKLEVEDRTQAAVAALSAGVGGHDGADDARA